MLLHYSTCCQYAGGFVSAGRWEDTLSSLRVWCLYSRLQSDNWQRHWRLTNRQLLLINVRWLHEILVVGEKYDRFSSLCSSVSRPKICDDFPHWGCPRCLRFFDFRKLSTVLESAARVQENKWDFPSGALTSVLVTITVKSPFLVFL